MSTKATLHAFFAALTAQEQKRVGPLSSINGDLALRVSLNELDLFHYQLTHGQLEPTKETQENYYILQLGVRRLTKIVLEQKPVRELGFLHRRDEALAKSALEVASALGMIEHGRRVAQSLTGGVGSIEQGGPGEFLITPPEAVVDESYYERAVSEHYRAQWNEQRRAIMASSEGKELESRVQTSIEKLVFPFMGSFIGYDADPLLGHHFFNLALSELELQEGFDSFNGAAQFGGVSYEKYLLGLAFVVCLALRHERFAEALVKKHPEVDLPNVLTVSCEVEGLARDIRNAINGLPSVALSERATLAQARQILRVLSVSHATVNLIDPPGSPLPPLIAYSDVGILRCQSAAQSDPVQFLLGSLRYHFPADYNKMQQLREASLRRAVKRVLLELFGGLCYSDNVRLRIPGRVLTDADFVASDASTGTVLLFQLKHQELYGADLHARRMRTARLQQEVGHWLQAVSEWLRTVGPDGLRSALRLSKSFPTPTVHFLILGRHYVFPVRELAREEHVHYGTWDQFYNAAQLVKARSAKSAKIEDLLTALDATVAPAGAQHHSWEEPVRWTVDDLSFVIRQHGQEIGAAS